MIGESHIRIMNYQVSALKMCIDLILNGYHIQVQSLQKDFWYFKLRHSKNGHIFEVRCDSFGTTVRKDGKTVETRLATRDAAEGLFSDWKQ